MCSAAGEAWPGTQCDLGVGGRHRRDDLPHARRPFLADFALEFGPAEYFLTAILALSLIAAVVQGATIKGLIAAGLGLLLSTVGFDVIAGHLRYTFDWAPLEDGIPLIQALVGLFAVTQALVLAESAASISRLAKLSGSFWEGVRIYFRHPAVIVRASLIGLFVGVLPAVGRAPPAFWPGRMRNGYRSAPKPSARVRPRGARFRDRHECVHARGPRLHDRAGRSGQRGCGGLPGGHDHLRHRPGPLVFVEKADVIYSLFVALFLSSFIVFIVGMTVARRLAW